MPKTVDCYTAMYKERPIGFIAATHGIGKTRFFRITRIVTIPDYQGIGVARSLMTFIGEKYAREGKIPLTMVTSNPQFVHAKIPNWIITSIGRKSVHAGAKDHNGIKNIARAGSSRRITISLRYVPNKK